jgi:hypothetical protein
MAVAPQCSTTSVNGTPESLSKLMLRAFAKRLVRHWMTGVLWSGGEEVDSVKKSTENLGGSGRGFTSWRLWVIQNLLDVSRWVPQLEFTNSIYFHQVMIRFHWVVKPTWNDNLRITSGWWRNNLLSKRDQSHPEIFIPSLTPLKCNIIQ